MTARVRRSAFVRIVAAIVLGSVLTLPATDARAAETIVREKLPNGLRVIVRENPLAPVVAVNLLVDMGSRLERPETAGLSNFMHAVMVKGTQKRSGARIPTTRMISSASSRIVTSSPTPTLTCSSPE